MQYLNGCIGGVFILLALLHLGVPDCFWLVSMHLCGAALAFPALMRSLRPGLSRLLAIAATLFLFFYFAGFLKVAPHLGSGWYTMHMVALGQLLGAFAMIPLLAEYSCRLKAGGLGARPQKQTAFFAVPRKLEEQA